MRIARDLILALRIKHKCFDIPIDGPANVHCDNNGVVQNMRIPESALSKKHNAINFHVLREAAATGMLYIGKKDAEPNMLMRSQSCFQTHGNINYCMGFARQILGRIAR